MQILKYFETENREYFRNEIGKADWKAASFLYDIIDTEKLKEICGENVQVFLLTEGENLISFCTYGDRDNIPDSELKPWIGFVYTFPEYRGKRRVGKLIEYIYSIAKSEGREAIYVSTHDKKLYEKYGFSFMRFEKDNEGEDSFIYRMEIIDRDYSDIIGKEVKGTIDRPLGCRHPRHPEMVYPINYGYVDGVFAGDGAEQDVYVFGTDKPLWTYTGKVVGVYHRLNDCEDKWIVSLSGEKPDREAILKSIEFQEQYFMGELYL